jgi:tol-pal system protein YbgF
MREVKRAPMKRILVYATVLLAVVVASGCATTGDVERVEQKVASTNSELIGMRTEIDGMAQSAKTDSDRTMERLDKLSADMDAVRQDIDLIKRNQANLGSAMNSMAGGEIMGVTGQMDELRHEVETSKLKLDAVKASLLQKLADIETALNRLSAQPSGTEALADRSITGAGGEEGQAAGEGGVSSAPPPVSDPAELYQAAYLDYTKGNYALALSGFKDYLTSFPDGEFAGNAQYWIGESLYSLGQYKEALIEFDKVLADHPLSPKAPGAMLKKGFCFDAIGRGDDARSTYQKVIDTYPASDAARIAADRLKPRTRGQVQGR